VQQYNVIVFTYFVYIFNVFIIRIILYKIKLCSKPKNKTEDNQIQAVEKKIHLFKLALKHICMLRKY